MANTEFQFKIIEKHLSGLEKKIDQIDKSISALEKKHDALEKKHDVIEKMVFAMAPMVKDPAKFLKDAGALDKDFFEKMSKIGDERMMKNVKKDVDQSMAKVEQMNAKYISEQLKSLVDTRLKVLEAQVSGLMKR